MAPRDPTIGEELAEQLLQALHEADQVPLLGARDLPILVGLKPKGGFTQPQENVLLQGVNLLADSGRVYVYGSTIVLEMQMLDGRTGLAPLRTGSVVEVGAEDLLANLLLCQQGTNQFPVPKWFTDLLLRSELLAERLPRIRHYASRPVFDDHFLWCGPGWHADVGILVHGPDVEPVLPTPGEAGTPAVDRLPAHLRTLLGGFCFRADADLANTIGWMLTGLLMTHFVSDGKPLALVDGNQPGLGKTLLVRIIGIVLDDVDPRLIHFTDNDEELAKRMCATLRDSRQSILLIDNAKVQSGSVVTSPAIESNSMAPEICLRILCKSENFTRPNDVLWALTMNDTRTSPDLVSRSLPIQLSYEGRPEDRTFDGPDPVAYAREHRLEILGELAGMVVRWNQQGRPPGQRSHRLHQWAAVIGGILATAGFPELLENAGQAAASFNTELDELAALAEAVIEDGGPYIDADQADEESDVVNTDSRRLAAREWERYFRKASVRVEDLDSCKSSQARTIKIGRFLSPNVGREVPVEVRGRTGKAVLRVEERRAKGRRYYFVVTWDDEPPKGAVPEQPTTTTTTATATAEEGKTNKGKTGAKATRPAQGPKEEGITSTSSRRPTGEAKKGAQTRGGGNDEDW